MSLSTTEGKPIAVIRFPHRSKADIVLRVSDKEGEKDVSFVDGLLSVLPDENERSVMYLFGPAGAGKSTLLGIHLIEWLKQHRDGQIYVFSRSEDDPAFEGIPHMNYIPIDDSLLDNIVDTYTFPENSFVVFDDIDSVQPKKLYEAVLGIQKDVLNVGRKHGLWCACTNHLGAMSSATKNILNEFHNVVMFPQGGNNSANEYILKDKVGMGRADIAKLKKLKSRWVCVRRNYPRVVMYQTGAYIPGND